jgi:signal transduction histidine kinase
VTARSGDERLLLHELRWLIRLRWAAGLGVVLFGVSQSTIFYWYPSAGQTIVLGSGILLYNALLVASMRSWTRAPVRRQTVHAMALAQILFDLFALTLVAVSSGGLMSPVAGFFVFHMVFASLLLPRSLAAICAAAAILVLGVGLALTGQLPADGPGALLAAGWITTLLVTLYLAERLARTLYERERSRFRLFKRGRRIAARLERQQKAMMQHEKMVAIGQLAAGVAHEINNPLASIDSLLQLMARKPEAAMRPETREMLRDQVVRIQSIVHRLTAFAHPDTGHMERADLAECVQGSLRVLSLDHRMRKVRLQQDFGTEPVIAQLVVRSFQQVLTNLVINALDAMSGVPEPRLGLSIRRDGNRCLVEVSDNGQGIAPEHLERIFQPFFTTKPVGKGTGLGLSISRSLMQEQGGELHVRTRLGEGTTFTIELQAAPAEAVAAGGTRSHEGALPA